MTILKLALGLATAVAAAGCVEQLPGISGTQSLLVDLVAPTEPGTPGEPLDDTVRTVTLKVWALDEDNEVDTSFTADVDVYVQFLGGLTPELDDGPLERIALTAGESADFDLELLPVFGPTFLWVEDGSRDEATYATGTSPVLWYRNPFVADLQQPLDEAALDVLTSSPLEGKQITVSGSRYGAAGRLVVTGVYAQGYTVSDVQCADAAGTPPCTTGNYDHLLVFTFSAPRDEEGRPIAVGQVIDGFAGASQEFNGLTELSFPQTFVAAAEPVVDEAMIPEPLPVDESWFGNTVEFERHESQLLSVIDGVLCELDEEYERYKQWKLDVGRGCGDPINFITAGVVEFDPALYVGQTIPRVVGTMRPVSIDSFNVWIMYPRSSDDLTLP